LFSWLKVFDESVGKNSISDTNLERGTGEKKNVIQNRALAGRKGDPRKLQQAIDYTHK